MRKNIQKCAHRTLSKVAVTIWSHGALPVMRTFRSFCMGSFLLYIENLVFATDFCIFSIIGMGSDCLMYPSFADLDRWGTAAVFWVIVCGKIYWKLSDKGDNKEKNAEILRKMGPNQSKIEILAKFFKFSNHWLLTVRNLFWNENKVFISKISSKKIVPVRFARVLPRVTIW